jgi:hypothetical protein
MGLMMTAGSTTRSPTIAKATSIASKMANCRVGAKPLGVKVRMPRPQTTAVWMTAGAVCSNEAVTAVTRPARPGSDDRRQGNYQAGGQKAGKEIVQQ